MSTNTTEVIIYQFLRALQQNDEAALMLMMQDSYQRSCIKDDLESWERCSRAVEAAHDIIYQIKPKQEGKANG